MLIEQIQLGVKKGSEFSSKFKVLKVENADHREEPICLKSAFAETASSVDTVELNVCGVAKSLKITILSSIHDLTKN